MADREFRTHVAIYDRLLLVLPLKVRRTLLHVPNGEKRTKATAAKLKRMGVRAGAADLLLVWQGRPCWIEIKNDKSSAGAKTYQNASQRQFEEDMVAAGALYGVARNSDEAIALCRSWGIPVREVPLQRTLGLKDG